MSQTSCLDACQCAAYLTTRLTDQRSIIAGVTVREIRLACGVPCRLLSDTRGLDHDFKCTCNSVITAAPVLTKSRLRPSRLYSLLGGYRRFIMICSLQSQDLQMKALCPSRVLVTAGNTSATLNPAGLKFPTAVRSRKINKVKEKYVTAKVLRPV
jgi:hypothetical protein